MSNLSLRRRWFRLAQISAACAVVAGCGGAGPTVEPIATAADASTPASPEQASALADTTPTPVIDLPGDTPTAPEADIGDTTRDMRATIAGVTPGTPALVMVEADDAAVGGGARICLLYTSPSPRD